MTASIRMPSDFWQEIVPKNGERLEMRKYSLSRRRTSPLGAQGAQAARVALIGKAMVSVVVRSSFLGGAVDIEACHGSVSIEVDVQAVRDLTRFGPRPINQLDIKTVRLGIIMQLHGLNLNQSFDRRRRYGPSPRRPKSRPAIYAIFRLACPKSEPNDELDNCLSRLSGANIAASHHSILMYGRFRKTCSSK